MRIQCVALAWSALYLAHGIQAKDRYSSHTDVGEAGNDSLLICSGLDGGGEGAHTEVRLMPSQASISDAIRFQTSSVDRCGWRIGWEQVNLAQTRPSLSSPPPAIAIML